VAEVPAVHDVADELSALCRQAVDSVVCDISDRAAVQSLAEEVGQIDVLINNAALTVQTPVADETEATARLFTRTLEVNLTGLYWVAQSMSRRMTDGGRIIFTCSFWGKTAGAGYSAYVASKHGMIGIVRTLAIELGARGISVNAVCPHSIMTEKSLRASPDAIDGATSNMVLHRGLIPPEDIAGVYLFLASPAGSEITGQAISVDRGAALF
jgi:NAD(P)-dependent dehydrogenase (short-subunit alcohol dehydrogenase family)